MKVHHTELPGVLVVEPHVYEDPRGVFFESWSLERYERVGLPAHFVQDNISFSGHGVLRGLHFQHPNGQGKLLTVLQGEIFDVAVDVRDGSPTFARWFGCSLSRENARQLYIPSGFAHGFLVTSGEALVLYKCTDYYDARTESTIRWDDEDIGIVWPATPLVISQKDRAAPRLRDIVHGKRPAY